MARFCGECGKSVKEGAAFCAGCGAKLQGAEQGALEQPGARTPGAAAPPASPQTSRPKRKFLVYAAGTVVGVLGLAICGAAYVATRMSGAEKHLASRFNLETILRSVSSPRGGETEDGRSKAGKSSARDVCGLISKEEMEKITGVNISEMSLNDEKDVCTYAPAENGMLTVTVGVQWQDGALAMRAMPEMSKQLATEDIRQPVAGIGDEAYILGVDGETEKQFQQVPQELRAFSSFTTGPLVFRKGDVMVTISAAFAEKKSDMEKKIAAIVVGRV